ncbi:CDF family Co(II)/Ni(II) efflux transporter DmeF [Sphingomonas baiyangensis]|uniref:CDF family Co(II)/Ni(II) efflux transporter DmeF n=1 Tax=Sphingomonas baiyangensis TaxID=2572576 RepID=A0A4U1L3I6_9SPHN|nr:CDF family Co(II)/Ni(II) efflux transporter DmeF [Sphingomonas baiyangensis]TKD50676.1 CDF family Co(II)/Ni(II) efflux transporter DmeF [Sphingomonas baiyangensis]
MAPHSHHHAGERSAPTASGGHICHSPADVLGSNHDANARRTRWVVGLTLAMMIVEIAAGWWTGSMALLADGLHMATHAGALGVAALAYGYARAHADDPRWTFGTGKVGDLAGFASAVALLLFSGGIAVESARRLVEPGAVAFGEAALVAVAGLLVNLASAWLLAGGGGGHHGHAHHHDNNLRAAYLHVLADALTSVLAIVALVAGRYLGWGWLDPAIGIIGAVIIARWSLTLMRDTSSMLLDASAPRLANEIERLAAAHGAHLLDLHVWRIGPHAHAAIVEIDNADAVRALRDALARLPALAHLTVASH